MSDGPNDNDPLSEATEAVPDGSAAAAIPPPVGRLLPKGEAPEPIDGAPDYAKDMGLA